MVKNATLHFEDQDGWLKWLEEHHATSAGIWLQISKQGADKPSLSHPQALEVALCYGWIDGQRKKGPEGFWLQRFSPRSARSIWSQMNRAKALVLFETGRMQEAGLAAIRRAKETGRWERAYEAVRTARIPEDLAAALGEDPQIRAFFDQLTSQNRYAILFRLQTATKPETRARRLQKFVTMLKNRETIYPQRFRA